MSSETIRCKYRCVSIEEFQGWTLLYRAKFNPVTGDSKENEPFFAATPSGSLEVTTITRKPWRVGQEVYLAITPVA